jgi:hypothetical protein
MSLRNTERAASEFWTAEFRDDLNKFVYGDDPSGNVILATFWDVNCAMHPECMPTGAALQGFKVKARVR